MNAFSAQISATASNCARMAGAPAIANTLRKTIMTLVDHIKAAMSDDPEPEPEQAESSAAAKP
eukprot:SAG11_NODE_2557_length_3221_cov_3.516336_5_plen_63_part_00